MIIIIITILIIIVIIMKFKFQFSTDQVQSLLRPRRCQITKAASSHYLNLCVIDFRLRVFLFMFINDLLIIRN